MTGVRHNEGCFAWVEDLDLDARVFWVRERSGHRLKTESSSAPVPLPSAAIGPLRAWLTHRLDRPPGFKLNTVELAVTYCRGGDCEFVHPPLRRGVVQILGFSGNSTDRPRASTVAVLSVAGPIAGSGTLEAVQAQHV